MVKYRPEQIRQRLLELLAGSRAGMSGVEIAQGLGLSRLTMAKYLGVFAAEGAIGQKKIGSVTLWFLTGNPAHYDLPDEYFEVQKKFEDALAGHDEQKAHAIIRDCIHSGGTPAKTVVEVILPAIAWMKRMHEGGKAGDSERGHITHIISDSLNILRRPGELADSKKSIVLIAAEKSSSPLCGAAAAAFRAERWAVYELGDMSESIDVIFDLDLQKFLGRLPGSKSGTLIITVFSETEEGLNFFAEAVNSARSKMRGNIRLALCGRPGKKTIIKADLISESPKEILQWSQSVHGGAA